MRQLVVRDGEGSRCAEVEEFSGDGLLDSQETFPAQGAVQGDAPGDLADAVFGDDEDLVIELAGVIGEVSRDAIDLLEGPQAARMVRAEALASSTARDA